MTWELLPNGLLPNEASHVTRALDQERWSRAEARTAELLSCIQPSQPSEERRQAVVSYVQRLITKCLPCQVFPFGSVPLKTYLPDGDIDLTAFSENYHMKETWANELRDMLENEEKNECAEFRVTDIQYIQADVKIIKCLVENIVVDISFNQLGGLCTLYFLEKLDRQIDSNHLFKRSIILIKAWCYYESRILGAHYGLISTYALETLVLYIFHVFDGSFAGPLEVLYRFLEFFSKFDWDNYCVSLWGPVPINSLPDMTADPPRKDGRELKLSKLFYDECSSLHFVSPGSHENQEPPFISKHLNIIDPLRRNNNLGRSVSKGNFFRIRSAFAFGAQKLSRLLHRPEENVIHELDQFFANTWESHGKGFRPDTPSSDACGLRSVNLNQVDDVQNYSGRNNLKNNTSHHDSDQNLESLRIKSIKMKTKADIVTEVQSRHQFARTNSSPELTCKSSERFEITYRNEEDLKNTAGPRSFNSRVPLNLNSLSNSQATPSISNQSSENCYDGVDVQNKYKSMTDNSQGMKKSAPSVDSTIVHGLDENEYESSRLPAENDDISDGNHKSDNNSNDVLPYTFYRTGPPVPFLTMIPLYNFPIEPPSSEEHKSDILCGDFNSYWQNLQYGKFCQNNSQFKSYPFPVIPPMSLEEHFPWDGSRRPPQFMNYAPQIIPVSSVQSNSNKVNGVFQQSADEIQSYRGGTGTYLPIPNESFWERPSSNAKFHRGNRSYDNRGEREGNWNQNSKPRFVGHGRNNQFDKTKRGTYNSNYRSNRPWEDSWRHQDSYYNGPSNDMNNIISNNNYNCNNLGYDEYPVLKRNGVPSTAGPPIVMPSPYDHNNSMAHVVDEGSSSTRVIHKEEAEEHEECFLEDSSPRPQTESAQLGKLRK